MKTMFYAGALALVPLAAPAAAQHAGHGAPPPPPAPAAHGQHGATADEPVDHAAMGHGPAPGAVQPPNAVDASGTSLMPATGNAMTGYHRPLGEGWMAMAHGYGWGVYTDQGGPRGDDMAYVQSMAMGSIEGPLGERATLELRTMLSLDPLMGDRGYPNLLSAGETAGGEPLVDRQHPHDFFMELAARLSFDLGGGNEAFLYGGPVGEPAIGPGAFMHRRSARYNPDAPITHHWFDSTHITFGVVTAGVRTRGLQIEASAFRGREPNEARWGIETPDLDSWSVRGTWTPSPRWAVQLSHAQIESPEALHGDEDEARTIASVQYASEAVSALLAWSAKNREPGPVLEAWLAEANWEIGGRHNIFGRVEIAENDELFDHDSPLHDRIFTVGKGTIGYAYRLPLGDLFNLALGGSLSGYAIPEAMEPFYGDNPVSYTLFARFSLGL